MRRRLSIVLTAGLVLAPSSLRAINPSLTNQDVERALKLGRSAEKDRATFHARYIHDLQDATVRQIEIVTEFRRFVLKTEERGRLGDWMFSQGVREAQEALRPWRGRLSIVVHLQFDPLNTYIQVPPFILVAGGSPEIAPLEAHITPISSLPFRTKTGRTTYLTGAALESQFEAASIGPTARPVSVFLDGKELARVTIDFGGFE